MPQVPGQCEVSEAVEGDVTVIHYSKDQGNVPALVGQTLEAAEVWDRFIEPMGMKIRLRPRNRPSIAFQGRKAVRQKLGIQEYWSMGSAFCKFHGFDECFRRAPE